MKNKIYLIATGEYSDYRIVCAFSSIRKANRYIKRLNSFLEDDDENYYSYFVDIVPLDDERAFLIPKSYKPYNVFIDKNGNIKDINIKVTSIEPDSLNGYCFRKWSDRLVLDINVCALDEKHAIKIANEKRVQFLANNQWGKDKI